MGANPEGEKKQGGRQAAPLRSWPLGRRSGRFPPLPYPPPRPQGIVSRRLRFRNSQCQGLTPCSGNSKGTDGSPGEGALTARRTGPGEKIRRTLTAGTLSGRGVPLLASALPITSCGAPGSRQCATMHRPPRVLAKARANCPDPQPAGPEGIWDDVPHASHTIPTSIHLVDPRRWCP